MTLTDVSTPPPLPSNQPARIARPITTPTLIGRSLLLVGFLLVGLFLQLLLLSPLENARAQQLGYANFRADLANSTAPTGQRDFEGNLLVPGSPIALLSVPGLGLERTVIVEGTESRVMMKGPGHRRDTVLPGQPGVSLIYGRSSAYGAPFAGIDTLPLGSEITVTTGQGEHTYVVSGIRRKNSVIPSPPAQGTGRLTLVTATGLPFVPTDVVYVDARLISDPVEAPSRTLGSGSLLPAEDAMGRSGGADTWATVALWSMALAVVGLLAAVLHIRWGSMQTWLVAFPLVILTVVMLARSFMPALPNLL